MTAKQQDRAERLLAATIAKYGVTDEALEVLAGKVVEQAELREALESELVYYISGGME